MQRRHLLQAALVAPGLSLATGPAPAQARSDTSAQAFRFAFLSDTHIRPEGDADRACALCFEQISDSDCEFVIHGGDHVEDALEGTRARATMLMDLYQRTERAHLRKKVHHVIGNHDCLGVFPESGIAPEEPGYGKAFYTERFGPRYYAFDHKGVHFVVLDSIGLTDDRNYEGRVDEAQLEWLAADLAALPQGRRVIVVSHIPLVTALGCYEPVSWLDTPHNWTFVVNCREVLRILRGHNVIAVLQGHSHVFEQISLNGLHFITTGAVAGADWRGTFLGTPEGYCEIDVDGQSVTATYRTYGFDVPDRRDVPI